ncbi:polysaccharide deacetylase family protein [Litoreibacter roseus]|uniref:Chitooligosaccharide deacetylase n=1 Tax=Litoreibacter roseus TaxID=2601869 RepID=A0A6N6JIA7_9RHOB|nr:polysaccharide deacetylase family protein [Litoreibacter roseus]GFE66081.1 hypothetical protein KIN_31550 [Litoreibacter roseus]
MLTGSLSLNLQQKILAAAAGFLFAVIFFSDEAEAQSLIEWRKEIALTFDDAPRGDGPLMSGSARTQTLINALEAARVEGALFFVTTKHLDEAPAGKARLNAYLAAGHHIANHSHNHPWLRSSTPEDYLADVDTAAGKLDAFEGVLPYFRYPYLDEGDTRQKRLAVRDGLKARNLANGYVTIDNHDWYLQALVGEAIAAKHPMNIDVLRETYVEVLMDAVTFYNSIAQEILGRSPRHVLLLNENDLAALFVDDLVAALRADGWSIIPAPDAYEDDIASMIPDTEFNGQGRVAALAHLSGKSPADLVAPVSGEEYLRALFAERGLIPPG